MTESGSGSRERRYWSERQGRRPSRTLTREQVLKHFAQLVKEMDEDGDLQEHFGYECVDGDVPGKFGRDVEGRILLNLHREHVWPFSSEELVLAWDDDTFFDVVEFLFDHVSRGAQDYGRYHGYLECGWHFENFDKRAAQDDYARRVNELLAKLENGYELDPEGEVLQKVEHGLEPLLTTRRPGLLGSNEQLVAGAVKKFRSRSSTSTDRRDAVRDLADVLEGLRSQVKTHMLKKDEGMLFDLANNYWIRHNDGKQHQNYDHEAWWSWMFYVYLSSITLVTHLQEAEGQVLGRVEGP